MALKILVTGGTFDKEYDEITGKLYFKETHMKEIEIRKISSKCSCKEVNVDG